MINHRFETVKWYLGDDCHEASGGAAASRDLEDPAGAVVERMGLEIPSPTYW